MKTIKKVLIFLWFWTSVFVGALGISSLEVSVFGTTNDWVLIFPAILYGVGLPYIYDHVFKD